MKLWLLTASFACVLALLAACTDSQSQPASTSVAAVANVAPEPELETTAPTPTDNTLVALTETAAGSQPAPLRCETDADCMVKDVGSCCGYNPQCVHKDAQTFPEKVKEMCEKEGRSSICGFQEPAGCSCVDNQCRNNAANSLQ